MLIASVARPCLGSPRATAKEALEREGYAVVRNFFSTEEIAWMRGEVTATLARIARRAHNGGLLCTPKRHESRLASRLLDDAQLANHWGGELPDTVEFQADTVHDWHVDMDIEPRTDAALLRIASGRMYKIAIHLQDHADRDGLSVIPGSHRDGNTRRAPLHLSTRAGDIVIFDLRIRHAGRLLNRTDDLMATIAWRLHRLHLVDDAGRHKVFRWLRHTFQQKPAAERLAIFLEMRN